MEDGVIRVFPALISKAAAGFAEVLDETVTVPVAVYVYPCQRRFDIGPYRRDGLDVAGAVKIHPGQQEEQRGGINGAVVAPEWHLAQIGHLAQPPLMQNFARLSIGLRIELSSLRGGKRAEHATVGSTHSMNIAVMMPSRPKIVLNQ